MNSFSLEQNGSSKKYDNCLVETDRRDFMDSHRIMPSLHFEGLEDRGQYNEESFLIYAAIYVTTFKKKINVIRSLLTYLQKNRLFVPKGVVYII